MDLNSIPSFYRGGHIIPRRERPRRSTATMADDPFTLLVALDFNQQAAGQLYLDDGSTFAFQRGLYLHRCVCVCVCVCVCGICIGVCVWGGGGHGAGWVGSKD